MVQPMTIASLFIITKRQNNPSVHQQMNEQKRGVCIQWNIIQSQKGRKFYISCTATWMKLRDIMLTEISQSQKDKYRMILFK